MVDILSGVPSIVAALFIFAVWITPFGFEQSAFAVSLALVLLMLPVVIRSTEEMLRLVPDELREASYALGIPKWKTIVRIVLPTALSGIISGILLAIARVMGETAPVLVLVGYSRSINYDVFERQHGLAAAADLHRADQPDSRRAAPSLGCGPHAHPPRRRAARARRRGARPPGRPQELVDRQDLIMSKRIDLKDLDIYYGDFHAVQVGQP